MVFCISSFKNGLFRSFAHFSLDYLFSRNYMLWVHHTFWILILNVLQSSTVCLPNYLLRAACIAGHLAIHARNCPRWRLAQSCYPAHCQCRRQGQSPHQPRNPQLWAVEPSVAVGFHCQGTSLLPHTGPGSVLSCSVPFLAPSPKFNSCCEPVTVSSLLLSSWAPWSTVLCYFLCNHTAVNGTSGQCGHPLPSLFAHMIISKLQDLWGRARTALLLPSPPSLYLSKVSCLQEDCICICRPQWWRKRRNKHKTPGNGSILDPMGPEEPFKVAGLWGASFEGFYRFLTVSHNALKEKVFNSRKGQ